MVGQWTVPGGWVVQLGEQAGRPVYRVTGYHGTYVGVCSTLPELERFLSPQGLSLADLAEDPDARLPGGEVLLALAGSLSSAACSQLMP